MTYSEKLRDPRWQRKRLSIMQRDGWQCRNCDAVEKTLTVHHFLYSGDPWETEDNLLITLCEDCHKQRQEFDSDSKRMLANLSSLMHNDEFWNFLISFSAYIANLKKGSK
jgi:hypothetical protein